jgi:hypothetical protein
MSAFGGKTDSQKGGLLRLFMTQSGHSGEGSSGMRASGTVKRALSCQNEVLSGPHVL